MQKPADGRFSRRVISERLGGTIDHSKPGFIL
jgi:hypothetical protein